MVAQFVVVSVASLWGVCIWAMPEDRVVGKGNTGGDLSDVEFSVVEDANLGSGHDVLNIVELCRIPNVFKTFQKVMWYPIARPHQKFAHKGHQSTFDLGIGCHKLPNV